MNKPESSEIRLKLLRLLEKDPTLTQREMQQEMEVSLGKVNYCISFLFEYANLCERIDHLLMTALGPVLNAPEGKLENRVFTLKTHQMFSVHTIHPCHTAAILDMTYVL